jgi:restriction system protein
MLYVTIATTMPMTTLPTYDDLMNPLLEALRKLGGSGSIEEIYAKTVEITGLPEEILAQLHDPEKSSQTEVGYRLAWARTYLKKYGLLANSSRGVWSLTEKAKTLEIVDSAEVVRFVRALDKQDAPKKRPPDETARELSEEEGWKDKLSAVPTQKLDPAGFERLVQRILRESGFIHVEVTGRTGDGGIDGKGIARIHGFMSFHVLFQCKRYKGSVGASEVRDFRGAMVGRADKGLFITTGSFTPAAVKEATRDGAPPIDLVDGDELAEKLKELALGVKTELVERVSVDTAWFESISRITQQSARMLRDKAARPLTSMKGVTSERPFLSKNHEHPKSSAARRISCRVCCSRVRCGHLRSAYPDSTSGPDRRRNQGCYCANSVHWAVQARLERQ